jgi:hypothetical protein
MVAERIFTTGDLLRRTARLARGNPGKLLFAIGLLTALASAIDLQEANGLSLNLVLLGASLWFQYDVSLALLNAAGWMPEGYRPTRLGALLGLLLLSEAAIFLGLLLLVVPGLLLAVRWIMSVPIMIAEETGIVEALRRSWEETAGLFWPILVFVLILYPAMFAAAAGFEWLRQTGADPGWSIVAQNLIIYLCLAVGWCAAVAAYALRGGSRERLDDVFA